MKKFTIMLVPILALAGCATTADADELAAQRASCEKMEREMGLDSTHDHQAMKGQGLNPMNLTHERCKQLLSTNK